MNETIRYILRKPYRRLIDFCESIEKKLIHKNYPLDYSPVFIIGVPRSGTTLLYQLLAYCYDFCYLSNAISHFSKFPCLASYFLSKVNGPRSSFNYKNKFGEIDGWRAPSQGWLFWSRWFPPDQSYVGLDCIPNSSIREIRATISLLQKIHDKPFLNKALSLGVRILPLNQAVPHSLFIRIHRNHLDVAQSILKTRKDYMGDQDRWISAKPSEFQKIQSQDYITQICSQIFYLEKDMDRDIKAIGEHRCLNITYESLCKNPRNLLNDIENFYNDSSRTNSLKKINEPPNSFFYSTGLKCSQEEYIQLSNCLQKLHERH